MISMIGRKLGDVCGTDLEVKLGAQSGFLYCGNLADIDLDALDIAIIAGNKKELKNRITDIQTLYNKLKRVYEKLENYKNLYDRRIVDVYPSQFDPNIKIVIIEGDEVARYWTKNEYINGVEGSE